MNEPGFLGAGLAGLLSFLSPCVLPLVPAYLSYISGSTVSQIEANPARARILGRSLAFSTGFTVAFTVLGIVFSSGAMILGGGGAARWIDIAGGLLIAVLGLNMIFDFIAFLGMDKRLSAKFAGKKIQGPAGAFLLGVAFAAGWSPCIGPILASILIMAGREGDALRAASLLVAYSIGFALPFIGTGLFFERLKPLLGFFSRNGRIVSRVSGALLIAFGILMASGSLGDLSAWAARIGDSIALASVKAPSLSRAVGSLVWLLVALWMAAPALPPKRKRLGPVRV
ncbi:MAG TPA: cytochrome c biogenesis protein CcdA, partial [Rectinemataceae bacterium]